MPDHCRTDDLPIPAPGEEPDSSGHLAADLGTLRAEMMRRYHAGTGVRPVVMVVDECPAAMAGDVPAEAAAMVAGLARLDRAAGMVVVTAPSRPVGRPVLRARREPSGGSA